AGDDDVLAAVLDLDVAVRVDHRQIAAVEPPALEGGLGRLRILQVALHADIALEHDFAHGLAVGRHRLQGFRIQHRRGLLQVVAHALPGVELGPLADVQVVPGSVLGTHRGRPVDFGQAVDVREIDAQGFHALDHGCGGCGTGHHGVDARRNRVAQV